MERAKYSQDILKAEQNRGGLALPNINTWFKNTSIKTVWLCGFWHRQPNMALQEREREKKTHISLMDPSFMTKVSGNEWPYLMVWANCIFTLKKIKPDLISH